MGRLNQVIMFISSAVVMAGCTSKGSSNPPDQSSNFSSAVAATSTINQGGIGTPISTFGSTDPNIICDPVAVSQGTNFGLKGSLYTASSSQNGSALTMISNGQSLSSNVYFSSLNIPTTSFSGGFINSSGQAVVDASGSPVTQNIALDLNSQLKLQDADAEGLYQFALISEDGSILNLGINGQATVVVNNDGLHQSRLACSSLVVNMTHGLMVPLNIKWYQTNEAHVALTLLWRKVSTDNSDTNRDPLCGMTGDSAFWDATQSPSAPMNAYNNLLLRGWQAIAPQNFILPSGATNICSTQYVPPQPTPSPTVSADPTPTPSVSADPTPTPSVSADPVPQPSPTVSADPIPTPSPTATPQPDPTVSAQPVPNPSQSAPVVCDGNSQPISVANGIQGRVILGSEAIAGSVDSMLTQGKEVTSNLFLNTISIPTINFDQGFTATDGTKLKDANGNLMVEWFALDLKSQLALSDTDQEGDYELAMISDDGAVLSVADKKGKLQTLISSDGLHSSAMACAPTTVRLKRGQKLPFELKYYQGPRNYIALTLMWRKVARGGSCSSYDNDSVTMCGQVGDNVFYSNGQMTDPMQKMMSSGWKILGAKNFVLPSTVQNPCAAPVTTCQKYVEITATDFDVPARDGRGTCYYKKLTDSVSTVSSELFSPMRNDMLAANHDGQTPHPRVMASKEIGFDLVGTRQVVLSSDPQGKSPIAVDNFLFVELQSLYSLDLLGYGTGDSRLSDGTIRLSNTPIQFQSFADAGSANVPPIDLTEKVPVGTSLVLRSSMLDCGQVGGSSGVYILFK